MQQSIAVVECDELSKRSINTSHRFATPRDIEVLVHVTSVPCPVDYLYIICNILYTVYTLNGFLRLVMNLFVALISYCMIYEINVYFDIIISVILKLHGGWLSFMLAPCCFGERFSTVITACHMHTLKYQSVKKKKKTCIFFSRHCGR